jgi:hypothetical protein
VTVADVVDVVVLTVSPAFTGVTVTLYPVRDVPPVDVGAVIEIEAVVDAPVATDPVAEDGADGADGATPIVNCAVPVSVAPLPNVVTAVIVNCVGEIAIVGVPEIVPVAVSRVEPSGSAP